MGALRPTSRGGAPSLSPAGYRVPDDSAGLLRLAQEAFALSTTSLCALAWATGIPPASLSRLLRRASDAGLAALESALSATGLAVWCIDPRGAWHPILNAAAEVPAADDAAAEGAPALPPLAMLGSA